MAKIKIQEIIRHLEHDLSYALKDAVSQTLPNVEFNESDLYRSFTHAVASRCPMWENVPDRMVEKEQKGLG